MQPVMISGFHYLPVLPPIAVKPWRDQKVKKASQVEPFHPQWANHYYLICGRNKGRKIALRDL
jgi:hypothetical protein